MADPDTIESYEPDYDTECANCGMTPTVLGVSGDAVVYESGMCGPCTWGDVETLDPGTWN